MPSTHPAPPPAAMVPWMCPSCRRSLSPCAAGVCCACGFVLKEQAGIWTADAGFAPGGFSAASREHLQGLEARHFWFKPRARLFEHILSRQRQFGLESAIELGCGSGRFLPVLARHAGRVVGVEGHGPSLASARQASPTAILLHGDVARVPIHDGLFDLACAFDVLEHVPPGPFLAEARRLLKPGGLLLLSVPAFPSLWSAVDERAGHRCRYRLAQARAELEAAGLRFLGFTHYQFLLFPLVWLSRRLGGRHGRNRLEANPAMPLGFLLGAVNSLETTMLANLPLPFGSSLVVWADLPL